jgi:hypothetical protein
MKIKERYTKATPPSPRRIGGRRRCEHSRPNHRAARWKAREVPPPSLRSPVHRAQSRLALHRGSRRDMFAHRSGSWAYISSSFPLALTYPIQESRLAQQLRQLGDVGGVAGASDEHKGAPIQWRLLMLVVPRGGVKHFSVFKALACPTIAKCPIEFQGSFSGLSHSRLPKLRCRVQARSRRLG